MYRHFGPKYIQSNLNTDIAFQLRWWMVVLTKVAMCIFSRTRLTIAQMILHKSSWRNRETRTGWGANYCKSFLDPGVAEFRRLTVFNFHGVDVVDWPVTPPSNFAAGDAFNVQFFDAVTVTINWIRLPFSKLSGDLSGEIGHSNFEWTQSSWVAFWVSCNGFYVKWLNWFE